RLYEMYMGPLETSKPWNTRDISGMHRFLQRAWRLTVDQTTGELRPAEKEDPEIEKLVHRTIAGVTHDIERMAFNTAIAKLIELVNAATSAGGLTEDQISRFSLVLSPFAPHMAEELWEMLGQAPCVADQPWPTWDEAALKDETIEIGVQVQGKLKTRIQIDTDADKKTVEAAALADPAIQKEIAGKTVRKVIVVPGRLVNIVAN
ncbi:MAG: class I tRNA ligase family protein, partial [Myxococcota bacterium]